MGASAAADFALPPLVHVHRPARPQVGCDLIYGEIVVWVEAVGLGVLGVKLRVVYDEQGAAWRYGLQEPGQALAFLADGQIAGCHKIEGFTLKLVDAGLSPVDVDASAVRSLPGPIKSDLGNVDRGDLPALLGKPDRIGALTAADFERRTRVQ